MICLKLNAAVPLNIFALFLYATSTFASIVTAQLLESRDGCGTNATWGTTQAAWVTAKADDSLASWWQNLSSKQHGSIANELGKGFGEHPNPIECGIDALSTCVPNKCSAYEDNRDPVWSYLALQSVVNLNRFFDAIHRGITNGQVAYLSSMSELAGIFFSERDPNFVLGDSASWVITIINSIIAIPGVVQKNGTELALSSLLGAGVKHVSNALTPEIVSSGTTASQGLAGLGVYTAEVEKASRQNIEIWANTTNRGEKDAVGGSILNYLLEGSFLSGGLPTSTEIEQYYKKQMISRTINAQWKKDKVFVMFFKTDNPSDTSGPSATQYYSAEDGGVYYLYRYKIDGGLRGHLDKPHGLDHLNNGTTYGISGNEITKSSARAFRVTGFNFNYTQKIATERIIASLDSNGTSSPFRDGAGWEGTWTLPVCDMGTNNWNTQFDNRTSRYGMLPCCCGPDCRDTKAFTQAANMIAFQTLLRGCKEQLRHHETLKFKSIDYGFQWRNSFDFTWALFSTGQKVGVGFGIICAAITSYIVFWCCRIAFES